MATIWMDGWEVQPANNTAGIWTSRSGSNSNTIYAATNARTGGGAVGFVGGANSGYARLTKNLPATYTEVYYGFAFLATAVDTNSADGYTVISQVLNSTATQVMLCIHESTNYLAFLNGDGTVLGTSGEALTLNALHYLELHIIISASVGAVDVRVDGVSKISLTNQDTQNSGNVNLEKVEICGGVSGRGNLGTFYFDDFVFNDTTGTVGNSWTDGAKVEALFPAADGYISEWTSTGGAVDNTEIDDWESYGTSSDGDTTRIYSITTAQRTAVTLTNTTVTGTPMCVAIVSNNKGENTAVDEMSNFFRISGANYDQETFAPSVSYTNRLEIVQLSPATGIAWTTAEIDGMELGFERVT